MKKALVCAHVASMIQQFNMENIRLLQEQGYQVDVACNMEQAGSISPEKAAQMEQRLNAQGVRVIHIPAPKKVTAVKGMLGAFRILRAHMRKNRYALIHCHSPIGGMLCRLANVFSGHYRKTTMIYTAHGFHFYQGADLKNWLLYYPVEWLCSRFTDVLITINREDYALAQRRLSARKTLYVPGVGVDAARFATTEVDRGAVRKALGVPEDALLLLSVGELNENKNHRLVIKALCQMPQANIHYAIAGQGELAQELQRLAAEGGIGEKVHVLGFRDDVLQLYHAADLFMFPSFREGLPVSMMEAMACGKAVICTNIRGNVDLIQEGSGGLLTTPTDVEAVAEAIRRLHTDVEARREMGLHNSRRAEDFDVKKINEQMKEIYGGV